MRITLLAAAAALVLSGSAHSAGANFTIVATAMCGTQEVQLAVARGVPYSDRYSPEFVGFVDGERVELSTTQSGALICTSPGTA